jgi:hypothetical protein
MVMIFYGEKALTTPNFPIEKYHFILYCYNIDKEIKRIGVNSDKQPIKA